MRHFAEMGTGVRLLMEDELDLISGGNGEDTDDVAARGEAQYQTGSIQSIDGNIDNMNEMRTAVASLSGRQTFSGSLSGWNYDSATDISYCTFVDRGASYAFTVQYSGNYCPDGYIGY